MENSDSSRQLGLNFQMRVHIVYRDAGKVYIGKFVYLCGFFGHYMPAGLGVLWADSDEWK